MTSPCGIVRANGESKQSFNLYPTDTFVTACWESHATEFTQWCTRDKNLWNLIKVKLIYLRGSDGDVINNAKQASGLAVWEIFLQYVCHLIHKKKFKEYSTRTAHIEW